MNPKPTNIDKVCPTCHYPSNVLVGNMCPDPFHSTGTVQPNPRWKDFPYKDGDLSMDGTGTVQPITIDNLPQGAFHGPGGILNDPTPNTTEPKSQSKSQPKSDTTELCPRCLRYPKGSTHTCKPAEQAVEKPSDITKAINKVRESWGIEPLIEDSKPEPADKDELEAFVTKWFSGEDDQDVEMERDLKALITAAEIRGLELAYAAAGSDDWAEYQARLDELKAKESM